MTKATIVWSAIAGGVLSLLVGVIGGLLAVTANDSIAEAIRAGGGAAGVFAGLWIAGTVAVCALWKG